MGKKWSMYLGELFRLELEEVGYKGGFELLDNALVFKLKID